MQQVSLSVTNNHFRPFWEIVIAGFHVSISRLTCMSVCAGVTVGGVSSALNLQAATSKRGI